MTKIYSDAEERGNSRWSGWKDFLFLPVLVGGLIVAYVAMVPVAIWRKARGV